MYVSISRNRNFDDDVYIFTGSLKKEIDSLNKKYLQMKVNNYKNQDLKANRIIDEKDYIDVEFILKKYDDQKCLCKYCSVEMELCNDNDNTLECDRINNDYCHTKDNCQLLCHHCNITKGNRF